MTGTELSTQIKSRVYPEPYSVDISPSGDFEFILQSKGIFPGGRYILAFRNMESEISFDQFLDIRSEIQKSTKAIWMFREVGLYLILSGKKEYWENQIDWVVADKTGLHSVIVNAVHFVDPETKENNLTTSSWGSHEFGDVRLISKVIEEELNKPQPEHRAYAENAG
jgi:hypothetical protein